MFDDLSPERRAEIRAVKSEEEFAKLTPHEMTYYRFTCPLQFIPAPGAKRIISDEELDDLLENGVSIILDEKKDN